MILINLLPHREMARKRRRDIFNISLGLAVAAGVLVAGAVFLWIQGQISAQQGRNQLLQSEIAVLEKQIKEIATLEAEIAALRARQQAVEDLQSDRNLPVHLLSELARIMPEGVHVASMKHDGQQVTLQGAAQSNERVSELLRNLTHQSPWFNKPELIEIVAGSTQVDGQARRVGNFTIRTRLVRPSEAQKAVAAQPPASAPAAQATASAPTRP